MSQEDTHLSGVRTRFAPSPTGLLHLGNYRTALFNYLFTRQTQGHLLLRIEDTDKERSKKEFTDNIFESLEWLGITFDEIHYQSKRKDAHKAYLNQLIESGHAYLSKEESKEEGKRGEVIRFKNPQKEIVFTDLVRGEVTFDTTELGDFVIAKSLEEPLFHLAVVADDLDMNVSHVIRGEDHISNTPRQILIQEALGAPRPTYAHIPLILAPDKSKLSKRKGAQPLTWYRDQGYVPEALINYMAFLGWNPGTEQEIFSPEELVNAFDITKIQKGGAVFNEEKLRWINKAHIQELTSREAQEKLRPFIIKSKHFQSFHHTLSQKDFLALTPILLERIETFEDATRLIEEGELDFYFEKPHYDKDSLVWKDDNEKDTHSYLSEAYLKLQDIPENTFKASSVKDALWDYAGEVGRGSVLWPLRYALSGKDKSPDPFVLSEALGKEETLLRIQTALKKI